MLILTFLRRDFNSLGLYRLSLEFAKVNEIEEGLNGLSSSTNLLARSCWSARHNLYQLDIQPTDSLYYGDTEDEAAMANQSSQPKKACQLDWMFVYEELELLDTETRSLLDSYRDNIGILDVKGDQDEARSSKLGAAFLPASFATTLLSMNDEFLVGKPKFWVF